MTEHNGMDVFKSGKGVRLDSAFSLFLSLSLTYVQQSFNNFPHTSTRARTHLYMRVRNARALTFIEVHTSCGASSRAFLSSRSVFLVFFFILIFKAAQVRVRERAP